jgi:hypothetical protein
VNVVIAGEESGTVRDAFARRGHNAWSCDLKPSRRRGNHYLGSWRDIDAAAWDLLIAHPVCTRLCSSGARWFEKYRDEQEAAVAEFMWLVELARRIGRGAIENPVGIMSRRYRKPDQIIQPWQFGHGETKATCLWLEGGLPKLAPTNVVDGREARVHRMAPGPNRSRDRAETYAGIAEAMAEQWAHARRAEAA